MRTVLTAIEDIVYFHEESPTARQYKLNRDEYLFLCCSAAGYDLVDLIACFDRSTAQIYRIRGRLINKFGARNLNEVLYIYGLLDKVSPPAEPELKKQSAEN